MSLQNQIGLINNPQEFTRLCNAVLEAEYGDDFLSIDDDRADGGNDGYIKSKHLVVAMHCFKRLQNKSIDASIKAKMVGDLKKAIKLKQEGRWQIKSWLFLSNYPISEALGSEINKIGVSAGIKVVWKSADYLASVLQKADSVRAQFPNLEVNDVIKRLEEIKLKIEGKDTSGYNNRFEFDRVAQTEDELKQLIDEKPEGWEYLLFGSVLYIQKEKTSTKWHDFEMEYAPKSGHYLNGKEGLSYLFNRFHDLSSITDGAMKVFTEEMQVKAFGKPGEPGDVTRITHMANHIVAAYEGLLDWSASVRSVSIPSILENVYSAASRVAKTPALQFKDFIDNYIEQTNRIPAYLKDKNPDKEPLNIVLHLTLSIDDNDLKNYVKLAKKAKRKVGY